MLINSCEELKERRWGECLLDEAVAAAAALLLFLELDEFQFAKRLEDFIQVVLSDGEMDVADIETMEGNTGLLLSSTLGGARLPVLFGFRVLGNDWNAEEFLTSELDGSRHGFFVFEFDVTDTVHMVSVE
jgi:hypothetical protein